MIHSGPEEEDLIEEIIEKEAVEAEVEAE